MRPDRKAGNPGFILNKRHISLAVFASACVFCAALGLQYYPSLPTTAAFHYGLFAPFSALFTAISSLSGR